MNFRAKNNNFPVCIICGKYLNFRAKNNISVNILNWGKYKFFEWFSNTVNLDNGFKEGQFFIQTSITSTCGRSVWITGSNASKQAWNRDQADLTSSSTFDGNIYYIKRQLFYKTQIKFRKNIKKVALLKNTFLRSCRSGKANYFECIERNQSRN